jgi:hypothetical protein
MLQRSGAAGKRLVVLSGRITTPPFSASARREAGTLIRALQEGRLLGMPRSRPMPGIGARCHELRIVDENKLADRLSRRSRHRGGGRHLSEGNAANAGAGAGGVQEAAETLRRKPGGKPMNARKQKQLEVQGWVETDVQELFGLTDAEAAYVELTIALSNAVRARRLAMGLTQQRLAELLESSQSRVAKMEAADPSVSLDLLIRALLAMGAAPREVGAVLAGDAPAPATPRAVRARVAPRGRTARRAAQG